MLNRLLSYISYGSSFCGIEVNTFDASDQFFAITAEKRKQEFEKFDFYKEDSLAALSQKVGKNRHAFLIINTDKVLVKEVASSFDQKNALAHAFPGLSSSEFFFEVVKFSEKTFVAVCRKEEVESIIRKAEVNHFHVLGFHLGFTSLKALLPSLSYDELPTQRFSITLENQEIGSFSLNQENEHLFCHIQGVEIHSHHILALSGLTGPLTNSKELLGNTTATSVDLKKLFLEKAFFRNGLKLAVTLLLVIVMGNLFFFNQFRKKYQQLDAEASLISTQQRTIKTKTETLELKESIVKNILNSDHSKSSFFINRLVSGKPPSVVFSEIHYQPLERNPRPDKAIQYRKGTIVLSGESGSKEAFSQWIETLEAEDWILEVTILDYGMAQTTRDLFHINLKLNEDSKK
ncbi:MAG: hypothetical protein AAFP76_00095 [Bacteroidota bacterium]